MHKKIVSIILWIVAITLFCFVTAILIISKMDFEIPATENVEQKWQNEKFATNYDKANELLSSMTIDEKIGQFLFARVPETNQYEMISKYHLGGYIIFGRDLENENKSTLASKILAWQKISKIPLFVGIDEEGGMVSRFSYAGWDNFGSPQDLYNRGGFKLISSEESRKIKLLESLGINVNFAPVADICTNKNAFMYERSFGKNVNATSDFIKTVVSVYQDSKVSSTLKHFPGYGNNDDTHFGIAIDDRKLDDFEKTDFVPFKTGIDAGTNFVMISHNVVSSVDAKNPASLSLIWHEILNEKLGFSGISITDDMSMAAIADFYHGEYPAEVQAILAGNNMMIVSDFRVAFSNIKKAVSDGILTEPQLDYLLIPVLALKTSL